MNRGCRLRWVLSRSTAVLVLFSRLLSGTVWCLCCAPGSPCGACAPWLAGPAWCCLAVRHTCQGSAASRRVSAAQVLLAWDQVGWLSPQLWPVLRQAGPCLAGAAAASCHWEDSCCRVAAAVAPQEPWLSAAEECSGQVALPAVAASAGAWSDPAEQPAADASQEASTAAALKRWSWGSRARGSCCAPVGCSTC